MTTQQIPDPVQRVPVWKRVTAVILDIVTVFWGVGYLLAWYTGALTKSGFELNGGPAFVLFVVVVAYFFIGRRYAGGTLWDRILRIQRPQPPD
jgi:hypothetical protein